MCASVTVYETVRGIERHRLEILVGPCQAQLRCCGPPLQAYSIFVCRRPPIIPLVVEGEQHHKENTGGVIKSC